MDSTKHIFLNFRWSYVLDVDVDDKCERQSCNRLLRRLLQGFGRRNTLFGRLLGFEYERVIF